MSESRNIESYWTRTAREDGIVHNRIIGPIGNGQFVQFLAEYNSQGPGDRTIWDLTESELVDFDRQSINVGLQYLTPRVADPLGRRSAFIADSDSNFGMLRMILTWTADRFGGVQTGAFRSVDDAVEWLNS